jgi:YegS/Rv2252/BmrU family lipid kinase
MTTVAVLAHAGKTFGGGLPELRQLLADQGISDPMWFEVGKSKEAPRFARKVRKKGAGLVFVWGGDGMVQRCMDELAGSDIPIAIVPAGTANLLATNLGIPADIPKAVQIGLHGGRRVLDVGNANGERFAVMAGVGFDALMIRDAGKGLKDKVGEVAYVWTGAKHLRETPMVAKIRVDGAKWFKGKASCVLVGNVGRVIGDMPVFPGATPDDGRLDVGLVTAKGVVEWARTAARVVASQPEASPFVETISAHTVDIKLEDEMAYELDGGERPPTKRLKIEVEPGAITICVPEVTP